MIIQKIMDRKDSMMKNRECINCGSTQFHQIKNGWKCDYCGTLYLNEEKNQKQNTSDSFPSSQRTKKKKSYVYLMMISIFFLLISTLYFSFMPTRSHTSSDLNYQSINPATTSSIWNNNLPGKWTKELYDSVVVATEIYNADSEKYSFDGGSNYQELEKIVGKPDTVMSWEKEDYGMPPRVQATWEKAIDGERAGSSIEVTYNKKTLMIIDKKYFDF